MLTRILALIRKEFIHIRRDFRTLIIIFLMPVVQLLMFGYAINMEIQRIDLAVIDYARTPTSSDLVRSFSGSKYFAVKPFDGEETAVEQLFQKRQAHAVLIIPQDFGELFARSLPTLVQILIDASDSNSAQAIRNYIDAVLQTHNLERGLKQPFDVRTTIQYNPALKSAYFFVPGLVALILMMISALLTSITIAREKETGTLEQILVSPVQPIEIIIGKVVPYIVLAFMDGIIILLVAHFWFEVPVKGSVMLILLSSTLFVFVALAIGLLISTRAQTQQVAMLAALIASLLPTIMLSGFIFPVNGFPWPLQLLSNVVPAKYFLQIIRGMMLKGNTVSELWPQLTVLVVMGLFLTVVSAKRFKMTLEG
jgi:ABC-2 type transport system permease protein